MTDKTVTVTLTEAEARDFVNYVDGVTYHGDDLHAAAKRVRAALPPEWEKGLYRITARGKTRNGFFDGREFVIPSDGTGYWLAEPVEVTKVEPLRVLGDDEIAVKRYPDLTAEEVRGLRNGLLNCKGGPHLVSRDVLDAYARGLAAEERAR